MMRKMKLGIVAAGLLAIPLLAPAQTRRMPVRAAVHPVRMVRPSVGRAVAPVRPAVVRVPVASSARNGETSAASMSSASSVSPNGATVFVSPVAASTDLNQLLNNVPGLGFDYSHLAALNGNLGERAFIDPVTQQDIALAEQLSRSTPVFTGGFIPFWGGMAGYSEPVVEEQPPAPSQPRVIILQEPVAAAAQAAQPASPSPSAAQEQPPLPDVGEFTLVLRDGSKIKAVAFTRQSNQIVYITSDGIRNSFPVSELDAAATQQLNRQHGTPLHLSL